MIQTSAKARSGVLLLGMMSMSNLGCGLFQSSQPNAEYVNSDLHVNGNLYVTGKIISISPNSGNGPESSGHDGGPDAHAAHGGDPGADDAHGHAAAPEQGAHGADMHAQGASPSPGHGGRAGHGAHDDGHAADASARRPAAGRGGHAPHWGYDGEIGPDAWSTLDVSYSTCDEGVSQSPIDIQDTGPSTMGPIEFAYTQIPLRIQNNGHTVQVDGEHGGGLEFAAKRYDLLQFHFHSPSEHRVRGRNYDMVVHLVHRSRDGELLVIGVPLVRGKKHPVIDAMWKHFPLRSGEASDHPDVLFSAEALLPDRRSYYSYIGSLTTPPCTEGVRWVFLKSPLTVSTAQIARFTRTFPASVRPTQSLNGRTVGQGR